MKLRSIAVLLVVGSLALIEGSAATAQINVDTSDHNHRFEAWGTSLAWMGNEIGGQSNARGREDLMDILFDQANGLGLNFARYNIGAGSNPDPSIENITRPGAKMEGWVPEKPSDVSDTSTWVWNWNADKNQRLILDMAIKRGVTQVEVFANSAPWWLTRNENPTGTRAGGTNLSTTRDDEFAHYMLKVVDHFKSNLGIHFETLAPMNEPGSGFWNGNSNQEGMGVPAGFYQDQLIRQFAASIESQGVEIKLVGLEETSTGQSADSWTDTGLTDGAKSHIDQVNTHTYHSNGGSGQSSSERLFNAVSADGKKIYASEFGTGQGALRLAEQIHWDIRYLDAAGWTYWQAVENNNGSGWGLAISDFNGTNPRFDTQDQYFAMKQFSAHIRPGAEIIELASRENITAAYDPRIGATSLVVTNDGNDDALDNYSFHLNQQVTSTRLIRTTDKRNRLRTNAYESLGPAAVRGGTNVSFNTVGNSITTAVIHHRPNLIDNPNFDSRGLPDNSPEISGWKSEGNAVFDTGADNSGDGSGSAQLQTDAVGNSGKIFQTGIGKADTDLTGVAYQLSVDAQFRSRGSQQYDANTYLALEFYGADDRTLASSSLNGHETKIAPAPAVKRHVFSRRVDGSDPSDDVYRTYRSERFVAPAGTRYVRPVVRFDGVEAGSNQVVSLDNIRLQEIHPEATARKWNKAGDANWSDGGSWRNHSLVGNNRHAYFGNAIDQDSRVALISDQTVTGVTFFSEHRYELNGVGSLLIGDSSPRFDAMVDVRMGSHLVRVETKLMDDLDLQVLPGTEIRFKSELDLGGHHLAKLGAGDVEFNTGFIMNGGTLSAYAGSEASIFFGSDAILDGDYKLLIAAGEVLQVGDLFELAAYLSLNDSFDNLILPTLSAGLAWDVHYGTNRLTAEVISAGPEPTH